MADTPQPTLPIPPQSTSSAPVSTEAVTSSDTPKTESDERFFAALGYFGPLFVLSIIAKPKSEYCKFHARQSMVLFLITFIVLVVLASISWIGSLLTLALFALYVLSIYRAYKGDMWSIPYISSFAAKINLDSLFKKAGAAVIGVTETAQTAATNMAQKAVDTAAQVTKQDDTTTPSVPPATPVK